MDAVRTLCQRAILFDEGKVQADGDVDDVVEDYFARFSTGSALQIRSTYGLAIEKVTLKNDVGKEARQFRPGDDLIVEIAFNAQKFVEKPYLVLIIQSKKGNCFTANMLLDGQRPNSLEGKGLISCRFKSLPLLPQRYSVRMSIRAKDGKDMILDEQEIGSFSIGADLEDYGYSGNYLSLASVSTPVVVPYEWTLPDGSTAAISLERGREQSAFHHVLRGETG
jgi:hypothetical protein